MKMEPILTDESGRRIYTPKHIKDFKRACRILRKLHEAGALILGTGIDGDLTLYGISGDEMQEAGLKYKLLSNRASLGLIATEDSDERVCTENAGVWFSGFENGL